MDLKPEHFEDLIPLVALYRPGPLGSGMVADFIDRRHGKKRGYLFASYLGTNSKGYLWVILYQTGYADCIRHGRFLLGQADLMRRAMGKKRNLF